MEKSIKDRWLKALRSGEYEQGIGELFSNGKYCCLGVACDIFQEDTGGTWFDGYFIKGNENLASGVLPKFMTKFLQIGDEGQLSGSYQAKPNHTHRYNDLVGLNDAGMDFNKIADIIEKEFQPLPED